MTCEEVIRLLIFLGSSYPVSKKRGPPWRHISGHQDPISRLPLPQSSLDELNEILPFYHVVAQNDVRSLSTYASQSRHSCNLVCLKSHLLSTLMPFLLEEVKFSTHSLMWACSFFFFFFWRHLVFRGGHSSSLIF